VINERTMAQCIVQVDRWSGRFALYRPEDLLEMNRSKPIMRTQCIPNAKHRPLTARKPLPFSRAQLRGARAMLGWTAEMLAEKAGIHFRTILKIERGEVDPATQSLGRILAALEQAGVAFGDDGSIRIAN
jgi:DNA-binding XRE family transcriptional regulator